MSDNWFPLESNSEALNQYLVDLGVDISNVRLHDVLSIEDWALEMIPQPTYAVIFLFPVKKNAVQQSDPAAPKDVFDCD